MIAVKYSQDIHYPIVGNWWMVHRGLVMDPWQLSDCGVMVKEREDGPFLAACWLLYGNSKIGFLAHPMTAPNAKPKQKILSIAFAIDKLMLIAKEQRLVHLVCLTDSTAISKLLKNRKFLSQGSHEFLHLSIE